MTLLLTREEVRNLISMPDAIAVVEAVAREEANGANVHMPPFGGQHAGPPGYQGLLRVTGGGCLEEGFIGVNSGGVSLLYEGRGTGSPLVAIMGSAFGNLRIGASLGAGARYLARPDARTVALLGSGRLALVSLEGLCAVRSIEHVQIYSPTPEHRDAFARRASEALGISVRPVASMEEAIDGVDIIAMATSDYSPVLTAQHLRPGVLVGSVGTPNEVGASVYLAAGQFVTQSRRQELNLHEPSPNRPNQAESGLHMLLRTGQLREEQILELGELVDGKVAPQNGPTDRPLYRDPQGGAGDVALVNLAYRRAKERGLGRDFDFGA